MMSETLAVAQNETEKLKGNEIDDLSMLSAIQLTY